MEPHEVARALRSLPQKPITIVTHKRSGTHLVMDLLRRQFEECDAWKWWGENQSRLYLSLQALYDPLSLTRTSEAKAIKILRRCDRPLVKSHSGLSDLPVGTETRTGTLGRHWHDWLKTNSQRLYVYRDGRAVMCSLQLLHAKRAGGEPPPISEFIREQVEEGVSRVAFWAQHVDNGLAAEGVLALRFEDLVRDTRNVVQFLADELNLTPKFVEPLLPMKFNSIWQARWARLVARRPQSTAILGRPRGSSLAKWQEAFGEEDREFFHREAGEALIRLGYETSDAWVGESQS